MPAPAETIAPEAAMEALAACRQPLLIGVRHHSPALAAAMPALLEAARPRRVLIELPPELQRWLPWLGSPALEAPVALASATPDGLAFYPFADFSPELAAARWAVAAGVPLVACDLSLAARGEDGEPLRLEQSEQAAGGLLDGPRGGDRWDALVEARAEGASPEALRRAALAVGWHGRQRTAAGPGIGARDLRREGAMRRAIADAGEGTVAVIGAFHAAALLPEPWLWAPREPAEPDEGEPPVSSLVPYSFDRLDERSGYPAGIKDPRWRQLRWQALREGTPSQALVARCLVAIGAALREAGHVAGVPDSREALRLAIDLARLRGLPGPGRRELLEGLASALGQGEPLGRARALARAVEPVLVGRQRGRLPADCPRSGLAPHVEARLEALGLPGPASPAGPGDEPIDKRLDPIRSPLDRAREVCLQRLRVCGVPIAERLDVSDPGGRGAAPSGALTRRWRLRWTPACDAHVELAAAHGVTLAQASAGVLRAALRRVAASEQPGEGAPQAGPPATALLELLTDAAEAGLPELARELLPRLRRALARQGSLPELLAAIVLYQRLAAGHLPGLPAEAAPREALAAAREQALVGAVEAVAGLAGSTAEADAQALLALVGELAPTDAGAAPAQLRWALARLAEDGGPLMEGAAACALQRIGATHDDGQALGARISSWVDDADRARLTQRLRGALIVAGPQLEVEPALIEPLIARIEALADDPFLRRLPALRGGFEVLSPAARQRLLASLGERLGEDDPLDAALDDDPRALAAWAAADRAGADALLALGLGPLPEAEAASETLAETRLGPLPEAEAASEAAPAGPGSSRQPEPGDAAGAERLAAGERWRLILGAQRQRLSARGRGCGRALDELYGFGRGEGASGGAAGQGGGREAPFPQAREWSEALEALFGAAVRDEVLAAAAAEGRADALLALDPEQVTPSVALLEQILALRGGLGEGRLASLRKLVKAVIEQLVRELSARVRPALTGLTSPRPTRRPGGRLDLRRTVRANLRHVQPAAGGPRLVPERLIFSARSRRSLDWRVSLVVDVSGSMDASVIYSALMAAILAGLPAVAVDFLAFSTEVVDLSDRVDDPLALLLELQVGGGTLIARGLRAARQRMTTPARTLVVLISDFEEGGPLGPMLAEIRAIAQSGARPLGVAALDDRGAPRYNRAAASRAVAAGMPVAALSPLELARWVGDQLRGGR